MNNKKTIELIKLSTIGCIEAEESAELNSLMLDEESFPWKELGEFQNLVASLPSSLIIETPSWELKDKVARKLYDLRDEIKTREEEPKPAEEADKIPEEVIAEPEEKSTVVSQPISSVLPEITAPQFREEPEPERISEEKPEKRELKHKAAVDRELIEKTTREYINAFYKNDLELVQKSTKKTLLISVALFILAILLIAFMYFKFSDDIDSKQQEIDRIKSRLGISQSEPDLGDTTSLI